jgi:hypothetical protein
MHRWIVRAAFLMAAVLSAKDLAGTFKGSYSGSAGASGDFTITLAHSGGQWKADVSFNLGDVVKAKTMSVEVDEAKVKVVYQFEFQGATLESAATGELKGDNLEGIYETKAVADGSAVDQGQWSATRQ